MDKKYFESSTGNGDLSLTIKGAAIAFIPVIIAILKSFGIDALETDIASFIESAMMIISAVMVISGLIRKFAMAIKNRTK